MTAVINSIYNFVAAIFSIPAVCCDLIYSLFSSTVPQQVARDNKERESLATLRTVVDQTQKRANPSVAGLRNRDVGSGSTTTTTQPNAPVVQPQPALRSILRNPDKTNLRPKRTVNFGEPGVIAQQQPSLISPPTSATTQTNTGTSPSTNSHPVGDSSAPQALLPLAEEQALALAIAESLKPQGGPPVHSGSAHPMMPLGLSEQQAIALAMKNSKKKAQDVYVPQVGQKVPLQNFIETFQTHNSRKEAIPEAIAVREKLTALSTIYPVYQPIRGDGNCFYTSFAVDLLSSFKRKTEQEKDTIIGRIGRCSAGANEKANVLAGLQRMRTGGQWFVATEDKDKLMVDFALCLRYVGADYINENRDVFFRDVHGAQVFDEEQIGECLTNMLVMGTFTDAAAPRAIAAAFGHAIRIVNYFSTDISRNYQLAQYYDITARGEEEFPGNWTSAALPEGPHLDLERILLYSGGHYSLLHKS